MNKNLVIAGLSLLLVLSLAFQYLAYFNRKNEQYSLKTDTITLTKFDTLTITKPVLKYKYITEVIIDTLYSTDSVLVPVRIPVESKVYQDSTYKAVVSGYRAKLDTIQVFPIHTYTTITNTVMKQKRWNMGIQVGVGYGVFSGMPDFFVGTGISYRLF